MLHSDYMLHSGSGTVQSSRCGVSTHREVSEVKRGMLTGKTGRVGFAFAQTAENHAKNALRFCVLRHDSLPTVPTFPRAPRARACGVRTVRSAVYVGVGGTGRAGTR